MEVWIVCMAVYLGIFMIFSKEYYRYDLKNNKKAAKQKIRNMRCSFFVGWIIAMIAIIIKMSGN